VDIGALEEDYPSEWASPSFAIPKKNGTIRVVTDFCWRCIPHVHIILDISLRLSNRDKLQRYGKEISST
jgi:hypothetical protein